MPPSAIEGITDAVLREAVARAEKGHRAKMVLSLTECALAVRLKRGDFVEAKSE